MLLADFPLFDLFVAAVVVVVVAVVVVVGIVVAVVVVFVLLIFTLLLLLLLLFLIPLLFFTAIVLFTSVAFFQLRLQVSSVWIYLLGQINEFIKYKRKIRLARTNFATLRSKSECENPPANRNTNPSGVTEVLTKEICCAFANIHF